MCTGTVRHARKLDTHALTHSRSLTPTHARSAVPCQAMRYPPNAFRTNSGEDAVVEDVDVGEVVVDSEEEDDDAE